MVDWRRELALTFVLALLAGVLLFVSTIQTLAASETTARQVSLPAGHPLTDPQRVDAVTPVVRNALKKDLSPPLRSIPPKKPSPRAGVEIPRVALPGRDKGRKTLRMGETLDPAVQDWQGASPMPAPIQNFDGLGNSDNQAVVGFEIMPPDTQGDVGLSHYVQWVNLSFAIWDKSGNLLYGPAAGNTLWSGFGGACENTNDGDPITLYDPLADRWLMSQFALPSFPYGPFYECIAVSTSGDPTGTWYRYAFEWEDSSGADLMNDYPKFGVWPDGYYMTTNQFTSGDALWAGSGVAAFERAKMLNGQDARIVYFDLGSSDWGSMLPADLDGSNLPPLGTPNYLVEANADEWDFVLNDELLIYEFDVDWSEPSSSTLAHVATLPTAPFDGGMCGFSQDCIPQPDTAQGLDAIADRLMHRLQYRNFGSHETLVTNLTVDADGNDHAGVRWFELRKTGTSWTIYQQGTYAPDDDHRWMGSIAMDKVGNIALGYSVSSNSTFPSIRYAGRLVNDPLGTLPQAEVELVAGSSFQAGGSRWGDYSMMAVDPVDDCTFWYTQEYIPAPGSWGNWDTRIGSFQFPACVGPTGTLAGVVEETGTGVPIVGARVTAAASSTYVAHTQSPNGAYRFEVVPPDTYAVTAEAYGYRPQTISNVTVVSGAVTLQDLRLLPAIMYLLSGTVTDAATGWPLYASLEIDGYPGGLVWTDPETGHYSVELAGGTAYTVHVNTWVDGYNSLSRGVGPLTGNQTEDFALGVDARTCDVPGYQLEVIGVYEPFDNDSLPVGWTVVENVGGDQGWRFDNPGDRENETGGSGNFSIVDSDYYGWEGRQDTELRTPPLDFSDLESVLLEFDTDFLTFTGSDVADVDVSTDGGETWTNVWQVTGASYRGPAHEVLDISYLAAAQQTVMVRFHYYDGSWEWWWQVDGVLVGQSLGCQPLSGGLVFGNVYDENTREPLTGAQVTSKEGELAIAVSNPLDPDQDDAFYVLFSPAGSHMFSATTQVGYGPDVEQVVVVKDSAVRQDFYLPTGFLAYDPNSLDVTLRRGESTSLPLMLRNEGGLPLEFEVAEIEVGFQPQETSRFVEVIVPGAELEYGSDARKAKRHTRFRSGMSFLVEQVWRPSGDIKVLLLTPDFAAGGEISLLEDTLAAFADLDVTLWDAAVGDPTADDLVAYDVVVVGNDYLWGSAQMNPQAVGDAVADYIDAGGKVIDTLFVHDYSEWQLEGRYITHGYAPFSASTTDLTATPYALGTVYEPDHPIMRGVTAVQDNPTIGIGHQDVDVAEGAIRLADWDDGEVFVAYNDNVVGVNQLWYHGANWTGDVPILMHNAILYLASGDIDWLSVEPISGTLDIASSQVVSVTFDGGAVSVTRPGKYLAKLHLRNDTVYGDPAIPLTMTIVSSPVCTDVSEVDLTRITSGFVYTNTLVEFSADIIPPPLMAAYSYTIDYGDGTAPSIGVSFDDPLIFAHTFGDVGVYAVEIAVWNCSLTQGQAVTDSVGVRVSGPLRSVYLPLVFKRE